ncbi:hypothetical protein [Leptospira adleri]|nr:hypothetical protein [Leptospira adleri]
MERFLASLAKEKSGMVYFTSDLMLSYVLVPKSENVGTHADFE